MHVQRVIYATLIQIALTSDESVLLQSRTQLDSNVHPNPTRWWMQISDPCYSWMMFFGLGKKMMDTPSRWRPHCVQNKSLGCGLQLANIVSQDMFSSFVGGVMPLIYDGPAARDLRVGDHAVGNPSIIKIPDYAQRTFPVGHFVAVFNAWGDKHSFPIKGCVIAVLDVNFTTLASDYVEVRSAQPDAAVDIRRVLADSRIHSLRNGDLWLSFTPYATGVHFESFSYKAGHDVYLSKLHLKLDGRRVEAWVDRSEFLHLQDASTLKNVGFVDLGTNEVLALVQIHPMRTARLNLKSVQELNHFDFSEAKAEPSQEEPWKPVQFWKKTEVLNASLHNGPDPIWIDEIQEYLGVGHFKRGFHDSVSSTWENMFIDYGCHQGLPNHHYSHLFFTMSLKSSARLGRVGNSEFCMLSDQSTLENRDCDTIQFVSSILRDGDTLHVFYGVNDIKSRVMSLKLQNVLASLHDLP